MSLSGTYPEQHRSRATRILSDTDLAQHRSRVATSGQNIFLLFQQKYEFPTKLSILSTNTWYEKQFWHAVRRTAFSRNPCWWPTRHHYLSKPGGGEGAGGGGRIQGPRVGLSSALTAAGARPTLPVSVEVLLTYSSGTQGCSGLPNVAHRPLSSQPCIHSCTPRRTWRAAVGRLKRRG